MPLPAFKVDALDLSGLGRPAAATVRRRPGDDFPCPSRSSPRQRLFAAMSWQQKGFQRATGMTRGIGPPQLDGIHRRHRQPRPGTPDFDSVVWQGEPALARRRNGVVLRRFRFDLDRWTSPEHPTAGEEVFGRRVSDGSPLSGTSMADTSDLNARDANGLSAIPDVRAHSAGSAGETRRADPPAPVQLRRWFCRRRSRLRLIFAGYCADPERQFVPIQQRLAEHDLLNTWIRAVGSAVFAIPPGFQPGTYLGQQLLG